MSILKLQKYVTAVFAALGAVYAVWPAIETAYGDLFPTANRTLVDEWTCVAHCLPEPDAVIEQDPSAPSALHLYAESAASVPVSGSYAPSTHRVLNGKIYGIVVKDDKVINWMGPGQVPTASSWDPNTSNATAWVRWPIQWRRIGVALFVGVVLGFAGHALWPRRSGRRNALDALPAIKRD